MTLKYPPGTPRSTHDCVGGREQNILSILIIYFIQTNLNHSNAMYNSHIIVWLGLGEWEVSLPHVDQ